VALIIHALARREWEAVARKLLNDRDESVQICAEDAVAALEG
jgi:hypothetical protein